MSDPVQHDLRDALRRAFGRLPPQLAAVAALALIENSNRTPTSPKRWTCRLARSSHGSSARPGC